MAREAEMARRRQENGYSLSRDDYGDYERSSQTDTLYNTTRSHSRTPSKGNRRGGVRDAPSPQLALEVVDSYGQTANDQLEALQTKISAEETRIQALEAQVTADQQEKRTLSDTLQRTQLESQKLRDQLATETGDLR
jgi:chromosome segregation ATPase